jgi:hypothetical protein
LPTNYVLIDFENVQPKNFEIIANQSFKIFIFIGANQTKVPLDIAAAMQEFGENAKYIKISGNGQNSLDFHIAFYIGQLSLEDPEGYFHVISKDSGFDPLIEHLKNKNIRIQRERDLAEIPILRLASATSNGEKITAIIKNLVGRGQSKPRKLKTLANTINSLFTNKLEDGELMSLIKMLQERKYIIVNQGNVSYKLPKLP